LIGQVRILIWIDSNIILAITSLQDKGAILIAGYNTIPRKEKYDEKALCQFMGWMIILLVISMVFTVIGELLENDLLHMIGISFMVSIIIFMLVYLYTGNRFKK